MKSVSALFALLVLVTDRTSAFLPSMTTTTRSPGHLQSSAAYREDHHMSDVDEMCMENMARLCQELGCDLDEYEALINRLQDQRQYHAEHVANLDELLLQLKGGLSSSSPRPPQEVAQMKASIERVLHTETINDLEKQADEANGLSA